MKADLLIFTNELAVGDDGWAQIAPFGDFPGMALVPNGTGGFKKVRAIQRIDRTAVEQMVNEYQGARRGVKKFLTSRPLFRGHPDVPGYETKYPDKSPKGVFANLAVRTDGFYGEPILTAEGEAMIANEKSLGLSGRWTAEEVGEENGVKVYRPLQFLSAGLTPEPNLPVQLLNTAESDDAAAAKQAKTTDTVMKKALILALLGKLGITLANDATDEQINTGLETAPTKLTELEGAKTTLANEKETLGTTVTAKETEITNLKTERDNFKTSFANERKARIDSLLTLGLTDGRITAAEKPDWERRLAVEANFANESEALGKLLPKVKTGVVTGELGNRKVELANTADRAQFVNDAIDAVCKENGWDRVKDYDRAYAAVQKLHPAVFSAMQAPDLGGKKKST